jgi:acylphosphatase
MKTYHFIVSGRVQGVFFRYYTKETAERLSIKGTVRNLANGDVEVFACGESKIMEQFEHFLLQGSPSARVDNLTKTEEVPGKDFPDFSIIY